MCYKKFLLTFYTFDFEISMTHRWMMDAKKKTYKNFVDAVQYGYDIKLTSKVLHKIHIETHANFMQDFWQ